MSGQPKALSLSKADLILLNNALNEILNGPGAIEAWEFQTRTGVQRSKALELLERISQQLAAQ